MVRNISPKDLKARLDSGEDLQLIDVREEDEREIASIGGELIPLQTLLEQEQKIRRSGMVVVYCRSGGRSSRAVEALQNEKKFTNLWNLDGGILAWSDDVDPTVQKY